MSLVSNIKRFIGEHIEGCKTIWKSTAKITYDNLQYYCTYNPDTVLIILDIIPISK